MTGRALTIATFECFILQNLARNDSLYYLLSQANLGAIPL